MNKKGIEGFTVFIIFIMLFIGSLMVLAIDSSFLQYKQDDACKEIGLKNPLKLDGGLNTCEDKLGNRHFVKFDCTYLKFHVNKCSAKKIKVGEVWGKTQ